MSLKAVRSYRPLPPIAGVCPNKIPTKHVFHWSSLAELPVIKKSQQQKIPRYRRCAHTILYQGCSCVSFRYVCVIQHRNWPLRSTILNVHGTNASPDGLCTRTHTNEAFSCWFCRNSFIVGGGRCGNVCLEDQAKACSPTEQPVRKFKGGLGFI